MKKFVHFTISCAVAVGSAALVAYSMAHMAHDFGIASSALRDQALVCAALITGLVMIEFLASREG